MANDININESAILETLNAKIDYDGGNYPSSGLEKKVNSTRVSKSGDTMTGSLISEQDSYFQFVAKSTIIDATATPASTQHVGIDFKDKNNVRLGWFGLCHDKGGATYFSILNFSGASDGFMFPRCTTKATTTSSASNYKVAVIVQNYVNGTSWYRVWSDGWIEQGGTVGISVNSATTITFLKAFANANYSFTLAHAKGSGWTNGANANYYDKTAKTIAVYQCDGTGVSWYACGY